jgi:hypothetical protein
MKPFGEIPATASDGAFTAMAYLKSIATGVFEEEGIISGSFVIVRPFYVAGPRVPDYFSQPVHLCRAFGPKRNPAGIGLMRGCFGDSEKFSRAIGFNGFKLQPACNLGAACEAECGQQSFVERPCLGQATHAQINVIVSSCHRRVAGLLTSRSQFALSVMLKPSPYGIHLACFAR